MVTVETRTVDLSEARIFYRQAGTAPRLAMLLHGWPQTSLCWRHLIPELARNYTVIAPDLRGYGESGFAAGGYDKRSVAADLHELVRHVGFDRAELVVGHDRGARVAHRWALDRPADVGRLALLDILPTREVMTTFDRSSAAAMWHWFFHLQPDLPELLIDGNVEAYLRYFLQPPMTAGAIDEAVFKAYVRAFESPGRLHASFEDYRNGFGIDLTLDEADYEAGRHVARPVLALWGGDGGLGGKDVLGVWRRYAISVSGRPLTGCGHYLPEEKPAEVLDELLAFADT